MQANEFDELIRKKFDEEEMPFKPEMWQKLSQQLPAPEDKKKRVIGMYWWQIGGIAAAVALLVVSVLKWQPSTDKQTTLASKDIISSLTVQSNAATKPAPAVAETDEHQTVKQEFIAASKNHIYSKKNRSVAANTVTSETKINSQDLVSPKDEIVAGTPGTGFSDQSNIATEESVVAERKKSAKPMALYDQLMQPEPEKLKQKTSFSFTGGVNYGSLNTGYALAVTAQRQISRKLYVEGNVGLVNGNADGISTYRGYSAADPPVNGMGTSDLEPQGVKTETTFTAVAPLNLYYFQVAPVIGYNVYKGLSVGVGADLQRLLVNEKSYEVQNNTGALERISKTDIGISGKTEYQVSKKVKLGVLYRNGISNLLKDKLYLDRDYLQVQFKYTFIH
ncbi:MAG: hypothetical protein EOP56_14790 [Sphingobacteriales bacterium]|nr:MAG: hypothetical protein EOP56_14790 [Sphingobacteriales bacterium]